MPLAWLSPWFQSLPLLPTSKLVPSDADSQVGGLEYIPEPHDSLQWTLLWSWEFLLLSRPPQIFITRGFKALVSPAGNLGYTVCLTPQLFLPVYPHTNVGQLALPATTSPGPPAASLTRVLSTPAASAGWLTIPILVAWYAFAFDVIRNFFLSGKYSHIKIEKTFFSDVFESCK